MKQSIMDSPYNVMMSVAWFIEGREKHKGEENARLGLKLHCKYLQPIYSHWLCYISNCNLVMIIAANGSTYDTH